ncbi:MAG: FliM/FliN family flagellar motor switch protein, partial [Proteobacteria bacterium]|nr:FliM/FliN family flagellar motor switch protein [Pseudomonadota bacterium]
STSFSLEIGDSSGDIHFCIPYATLEPIRDVLYSNLQGGIGESDRRWVKLLKHQIQAAEVALVAELGHASVNVEQLLALKAGDFVELEIGKRIEAKVDGVPVFECGYGTSNGRYALKVEQTLVDSEVSWLGEPHV